MKNLLKVSSSGIIAFSLLLSTSSISLAVNNPAKAQEMRTQAQEKMAEGKTKACQAKEASIKQRSTQLAKMAENMLDKFSAIADRVEQYYTGKVVPSGKTVSNYNSLISDMATKKAAVQTALTTAQNDASSFSCTSEDPKAELTQYRKDMQAVKSALQSYRTSIKNLIVAVRGVAPSDNQKEATPESK